jgi:hypothetical protein
VAAIGRGGRVADVKGNLPRFGHLHFNQIAGADTSAPFMAWKIPL